MTDTELIDALAAMPNLDGLCRAGRPFGEQWMFYDHRGAPNHKGWVKCASFREAIQRLVESRKAAAVEQDKLVERAMHDTQSRADLLQRNDQLLERLKAEGSEERLKAKF